MSKPRWTNREVLDNMIEIWGNVSHFIYDGVKKRLLKENLISKDDDIDFSEDMNFSEDWKMLTTILRLYSDNGILDKREIIEEMNGKIFIFKKKRKLEPSFKFTVNRRKKFFSFDIRLVKRLLEEIKSLEDNSAEAVFGKEMARKLIVFDLEKDNEIKKIMSQTKPMMDQLGFSEDEAMLTIHQAIKHKDFKEGMAPENIVGIALEIRRDGMLK